MNINEIAKIVNEKAALYDDRDLAFAAQLLDRYTIENEARQFVPPHLLSIPDCADALSLSRDYVWRLVASGKLRSVKFGKRRLVKPEALQELLAERERAHA